MKGNFASNCVHLPTPWPYLPQKKHNTVDQSLRVVTGRGCGACDSVPGSRRFSIVSRPADPTEGPLTSAMTCFVGTSIGSLTTYTGRGFSGVGLATLRSSMSHTLYIVRRFLEWEYQAAHYRGAATGHSLGDRL